MSEDIKTLQINNVQTATRSKLKWMRRMSQTAMLFVIGEFGFYGVFRCPFAVPYVSCASCPVVQCPGRWMVYPFWVALGVSVIFFGRAFCGWACPGGLASDLLSSLSNIGNKIKGSVDAKIHLLKYLVLAAGLVLWLFSSNPRWAIPIRTGEFWASVSLTFQHANNLWLMRTLFVLGFMVLGGILGSLWCRYLCPTGGALEGVRRFGFYQFRRSVDCNDCNLCLKTCKMNTQPEGHNCINCGDCLKSCRSKAIFFGRKKGT